MFHPDGPSLLELARQALSSTERGYDLLAPKFDRTPFRTPDEVLDAVAPHLGPPVARGLDLCCGTGAGMRLLRPLCAELVVGLDMSQGMLEQAERCSAGWPGGARLEFVRGDALATPFPDGAFDLITCHGAFGHILEQDEPRLVDEVQRLLRPGGRFAFLTGDRLRLSNPWLWVAWGFNGVMRMRNMLIKPEFVMYYLTFRLQRARALLEERGFGVEVIEGVLPHPWGRMLLVVATR